MAVTPPVPAANIPASRPRRQNLFWSRLHFVIRFLGLTGVLIGCAGFVLALFQHELPALDSFTSWRQAYATSYYLVQDALAQPREKWRTLLLVGGAAAALFALLVEVVVVLGFTAGRRSAFGFNAVLQGALAALLLIGVNVWSFQHSWRVDFTRDQRFTLPSAVRDQLAQLDRSDEDEKNKTTVIVYQCHASKADRYDRAAERKVVEKVKDLAEQLGQVGSQLKVVVLDNDRDDYEDRLEEVTKDSPALRQSIEEAPENSIFIQSGNYVRQMRFNEFYYLDKVASRQANDGKGNLVLLAQGGGTSGRGVEVLADKILNLEERQPRVGVLVVHELLTTEGSENIFTLRGLRKMLQTNGFTVRDVVLRKGWDSGQGEPSPSADTFEESKLERLEIEMQDLDEEVKALTEAVKTLEERVDGWSLKPDEKMQDKLDQLSKKYSRQLGGEKLTPRAHETLLAYFRGLLKQGRQELEEKTKECKDKEAELNGLNVDRIVEARRMSDLKAKFKRSLDDCDLLFVPRLTRRSSGGMIPNRVHKLSDIQAECIQEFIQAGKPVFVCFGPVNEPSDLPPDTGYPDKLEPLLKDLGVHFGKQTVLFSTDSKMFDDRRRNPLRQAEMIEPPPLDFDTPPETARGTWLSQVNAEPLPPNPLREALRVTAHRVGKGFDLRLRFPRPIYFEPPKGKTSKFEPTFLLTASGWNDDQPFVVRGRRPHYEQPKPDDPDNSTIDAKRRGPFPVGIAVEAPLPDSWTSSGGTAKSVRLAVIGQGEVFVGPEPGPKEERNLAKEQLFLQTANWLLGRDDYLPRADHPWSYPRVPLPPDSAAHRLWLWGAFGLPLLFAYLGLVVLLIRRLR